MAGSERGLQWAWPGRSDGFLTLWFLESASVWNSLSYHCKFAELLSTYKVWLDIPLVSLSGPMIEIGGGSNFEFVSFHYKVE